MLPLHPRRTPALRLAAVASLALIILAAGTLSPSAADARRPWTPSPPRGPYTPRHVWQTRDNCVFASGQMLLDKWTHGRIRVGQAKLRTASFDDEGGAGFRDLASGVTRATGIRLRWSPGGGDPMTWWQLLDRLERDGGAVLFGQYGRLPAAQTRWAPAFARADNDDHAVYVERYDRANGRVWLMDPLAVGGFSGEWIGVRALRRFARFDGDLVYAAATPARHRPTTAPLTDQAYRLGTPVTGAAIIAGSEATITVPLAIVDGFPLPAAHSLAGHWERLGDALGELGRDDAVVLPAVDGSGTMSVSAVQPADVIDTRSADARPTADGFTFTLTTPEGPGRYRLSLVVVPAGAPADHPARSLASLEVRVDPPYAGSVTATAVGDAPMGSAVRVDVTVANLGTVDWRPAPPADAGPGRRVEIPPGRPAALTIAWRTAAGDEVLAGEVDLALAPGERASLVLDLIAPATAGAWTLELDVVHPADGSLVAAGMASTAIPIVLDPPTADPIH